MIQSGSLELAYIGDAVWELYVRSQELKTGCKVNALHKQAVNHVRAGAQAEALRRIAGTLTEEETAVTKRARNTRQSPTKNADIADYHMATAFEALLGWLYLNGMTDRLNELMASAYHDGERPDEAE